MNGPITETANFTSDTEPSGWHSPSTTGSLYNTWTNPSNALASDDSYAQAFGYPNSQDYGNFGFYIPRHATIQGIEVKIECHAQNTQKILCALRSGVAKYNFVPIDTDAIVVLGSSTDLWGRSWQATDFSDTSFHPFFADGGYGIPVYVDHISINIHYQLYADLNRDGIVDIEDFAILAEQWLGSPGNPSADISPDGGNGVIDLQDFVKLAEAWGEIDTGGYYLDADLNRNGIIDFADFNVFSKQWMGNCNVPDWCSGCDFNKNGSVDLLDLEILAKYWLEGT